VDPMLACWTRGYTEGEWCRSCAAGLHSTCERAGEEGPLAPGGRFLARGMMTGYHRDLPGGWAEEMVAHHTQCFRVDPAMSDHAAVMIEPLSVALHAIVRGGPRPDTERVLVIGSGPIALSTVWALRATGFDGEVVAQMKRLPEAELARALGATAVVTPGDAARESLVATGARGYMPLVGEEVFAGGGYPLVVDCVGNRGSLSQALRFAAPRGRIVLLGCSAEISKLDLTFTWARELEIRGFLGYGSEEWQGERLHTFELTRRLLAKTGAPVERMVTHVFALDRYREALAAAANHRVSGAVKVIMEPGTTR
jgi:L-iditol 2-dehydrogenase